MSIRRFVFFSLLGLAIAFLGVNATKIEPRSPFAKRSVVNPEQKHIGPWLPGKPNSPLRIYLFSPRGLAHETRETTEIAAKIQLTREMLNEVKFRWQLPDGVQVVKGQTEGILPSLRPREIHRVSITVTGIGVRDLPKNVSLTVSTDINGQPIAATGIFASHEMQANGSFRARRERGPASLSIFSNKSSQAEDDSIPVVTPPKGIHF